LAERTQERRRQFATAMDAFMDGRYLDAHDGFVSILAASPDDDEVASMLERTENAIDREADDLLEQAERYIGWGRFADAERSINAAYDLAPENTGVQTARTHLKRAKRAHARDQSAKQGGDTTTAVSVRSAKVKITEEQRREAKRLYDQALEAVSQRRSDDAIRYLELVWAIDPDYQRVGDHLKREYLTRGMEFFADGDLERAVDLWERVLRVDPDDERARGYLTRAREQATRTREILGGSR
jgi:tetratricopeptide (TPR) repeat protein